MSLIARNITAGYGQIRVLNGVNLEVAPGQIHCVFGPNGSGKSTLLKVCAGMLRPWGGSLELDEQNLLGLKGHQFIRSGIVTVPQSGGVFPELSVAENLMAGGLALSDNAAVRESIQAMYRRFPILGEKRNARGGSLSGGQRMLLAFARALVSEPKVLLLDEPSAGLAPLVVKEVFGLIKDLRAQGPAILLIEQAVRDALPLADQVTVLAQGEVQFQGQAQGLSEAKLVEAYLGVKM
ncbi:MAG: ABC transporter ATP-binding protein [Thermaceae bacterium]|nr:ABC transporter ATP-binding protein [Thermaceae bacterium]